MLFETALTFCWTTIRSNRKTVKTRDGEISIFLDQSTDISMPDGGMRKFQNFYLLYNVLSIKSLENSEEFAKGTAI